MGGKIIRPFGISLNYLKSKKSHTVNQIIIPDFLSGCCMLIPAHVIRQIGLFNEQYFAYWEDTEFSFRAKTAGFQLAVLPTSVIWHKHSQSTALNPGKKQYLLIRNHIIFGRQYFHWWEKIGSLALCIPLFHLFLNLLRYKNIKFIRYIWHGYSDGLKMSKPR